MTDIQRLAELINAAKKIVFVGGAGVSCESGIPDFRSADGIYSERGKYPPEEILSNTFFFSHTEDFYKFYREKMLYPDAKPNYTHTALAELEKEGKLAGVITQNIDGLHQDAGSKAVYEIHGTVRKNRCLKCGKKYGVDYILATEGVPKCECGGLIKPEVVLYGECMDDRVVEGAIRCADSADLMIVGGTSLAVNTAAFFVSRFGGKLAIVNMTPTPYDRRADIVIHKNLSEVFRECMAYVKKS